MTENKNVLKHRGFPASGAVTILLVGICILSAAAMFIFAGMENKAAALISEWVFVVSVVVFLAYFGGWNIADAIVTAKNPSRLVFGILMLIAGNLSWLGIPILIPGDTGKSTLVTFVGVVVLTGIGFITALLLIAHPAWIQNPDKPAE